MNNHNFLIIISMCLLMMFVVALSFGKTKQKHKIKQQQEIIYTLQSDLVKSIENSLDRTNALAASNYGKIKKLEEHFGLEIEE